MLYRLYNKPAYPPIEQILVNRGIPHEDIQTGINAGGSSINSPWLLGEEKVEHAIQLIVDAVLDQKEIGILIDPDVDGFTSAAIIINYITSVYGDTVEDNINYILHTGKQHGLNDCVNEFPADCLVILPDSSTNDTEEMRQLLDNGCTIVCVDHHEADNYLEDEDNLVIINNQINDYPNKDLSAAGVIGQVCRAWDEIYENDKANDLIDLAALGVKL